MIMRAKISALRASGCGAYSRAALINFFVPDAALNRVNTVLHNTIFSMSIRVCCSMSLYNGQEILCFVNTPL